MTRPDVDELDIDPINRGNEFRQGHSTPARPYAIILASPVANQFLDTLELDAWRYRRQSPYPANACSRSACEDRRAETAGHEFSKQARMLSSACWFLELT